AKKEIEIAQKEKMEGDLCRQEREAASTIQGLFRGVRWRRELGDMKRAAKVLQHCWKQKVARRAAEKAERLRLNGPEVVTVYKKGTVVSGTALMLSVLRCGLSFMFVGADQHECCSHRGYFYEFE
ncbi:unnamed protein product, partial [Choristocarpus tenellus]